MIRIAKRGKTIDLTGMIFGHLKVLNVTKDKNGAKAWLVECDCENKTQLIIETGRLKSGKKQHCGCLRVWRRKETVAFPNEYINKFKVCNQCGNELEYKDYYFTEYINVDGLKSYTFNPNCIECDKENSRKRGQDNREVILEQKRVHYQNNKDYKDELHKQWVQEHEEENYSYTRGYRQSEVGKQKFKESQEKRKAKDHKITPKEWIACKDYFKDEDGDWACIYCGLKAKNHYRRWNGELQNYDLHKEHVDDKGSADLDNCVCSCGTCNSEKHTSKLEEWYNKNNPKFEQWRYDKIIKWITDDYKKYIEEKKPRKPYTRKQK